MFALFNANARIIDKEKMERLSRMLFEEARQTLSNEKLEEKLASISLTTLSASSKESKILDFT